MIYRQIVFKNATAPAALTRKEFDFASQKVAFKAPSTSGDPGTFEGYGAVYGNVDRDNEIIAPGAFAESLPAFIRDGFIACAHEWDEGIATVEDAYEDGYGLYIKCQFHGDSDSQATRIKTMERIDRGKSVGLSVGFMPETWAWDEETGIRTITKATLYEVSIVTVPCNPLAQVVSAKSGSAVSVPATVREFERFLRDAGFSKDRACAIASKGFACGTQDEPTPAAEDTPAAPDDDNEDADGIAQSEFLYLQFEAQSLGVKV
jgi:HK97 family phage prohead protease